MIFYPDGHRSLRSPENTASRLGSVLRGGNGVVLPLQASARASVYLLVGGIERKLADAVSWGTITESREESKRTGLVALSSLIFQHVIEQARRNRLSVAFLCLGWPALKGFRAGIELVKLYRHGMKTVRRAKRKDRKTSGPFSCILAMRRKGVRF